ncbi:hypothetical protein HZH68_007269 [Vespula germanica]|uniref:Uncharacterized protein n=1 Tax=Vespula germanica TaxID=30212 RepID=A0A834NAY1_VESGE|nr:hypothetical protein HZH68_007269 [Vespula germanica]
MFSAIWHCREVDMWATRLDYDYDAKTTTITTTTLQLHYTTRQRHDEDHDTTQHNTTQRNTTSTCRETYEDTKGVKLLVAERNNKECWNDVLSDRSVDERQMTKETNDKSCFWLLLSYDDDDDNDDDDDEDNDDDDDDDDDEESWGTQTYSAQFP